VIGPCIALSTSCSGSIENRSLSTSNPTQTPSNHPLTIEFPGVNEPLFQNVSWLGDHGSVSWTIQQPLALPSSAPFRHLAV